MISFENVTDYELYTAAKKYSNISFEYVPNTAAGYERCRCYINMNGFRYFLSAINEKDRFLSCEDNTNSFSVNFSVDGNQITIKEAHHNGRKETADKYLKKYMQVITSIHSCIKFEKIVEYVPYPYKAA